MSENSTSQAIVIAAKPDRKIFRAKPKLISGIPAEISEDPELLKAISILPQNYNFEIPKTVWRIRKTDSKCVALQFPEGLLIFSLTIADILKAFTDAEVIILGDVTYGACCIDDFTAKALGADLMVHYGHSCLVPVSVTKGINLLYIFVDIRIDTLHLIETIEHNFPGINKLTLVSTIQFVPTIHQVAADLKLSGHQVEIPQSKPLSPGEVLGCTSPRIMNSGPVIFVGDGRFHLESVMIANPSLDFYRYNPYDKKITKECYDYAKMTSIRKQAIDKAVQGKNFGLILGTLGRQGSPKVMENIKAILKKTGKNYITVLLSEVFPDKLKLFSDVDAWVQIACPRLSIDWGYAFEKPLLTPYEFAVVTKQIEWRERYPMDFYASKSLGSWTPNHIETDDSCATCSDCSCTKDK